MEIKLSIPLVTLLNHHIQINPPPMDQFSGNDYPQTGYSASSNRQKIADECKPSTAIMFLSFKIVPILIYLMLKLMTDQYLSTFILIAVMLSMDFWVTKNIAGRQLAALRWYSKISDNNKETWCFQSSQNREPSGCNRIVFWFGQLFAIVFWVVIVMINIITLSTFWIFLAIFCLVLLICNFVFFLECKGEHQKKVNSLTKRMGVQFFQLAEDKH